MDKPNQIKTLKEVEKDVTNPELKKNIQQKIKALETDKDIKK